jgi:hypothetical protein
MDRIRASDTERERVAGRLRDAAVEGRLTVDELDERTARAYAAVTRGELAALLEDLPAPRPRAPVREPRREKLPWFPGRYAFEVQWTAPADRARARDDIAEFIVPAMRRFGYTVVDCGPDYFNFERRTFATWTLLPAVFLFPFGLLALLIRNSERVEVELLGRGDETRLVASGVAPLPVRRAFAGLLWS